MKTKVIETIMKRRSTRIYSEQQLTDSEIKQIIEAGCYAPSAHNCQSTHFTVVQNKEFLTKLNDETKNILKTHPDEIFRKMANNSKYDIFYNAPTVVLVSGDSKGILPETNCSAAIQNMLLAAESLDIGTCWVGLVAFAFGGENGDALKAELQIAEDYKVYYAVTLGYKKIPDGNAPKRKENKVNYVK